MKFGPAALGAACAVLVAPRLAAADLPLSGIAIGKTVGALAQTLGPPVSVRSVDAGNRFAFSPEAAAYADDDGVVLAVDMQNGNPRIDVDGVVRSFPIGSYSAARADAELADVAEFTTPTLRSYRLAPRRDLVLGFSASTGRLERVVYGEPGQLARLGLLPGDGAAKAVVYRAPRLRGRPAAPTGGAASRSSVDPGTVDRGTVDPGAVERGVVNQGAVDQETVERGAVYRVAIDRSGAVRSVDVVIASTAPDNDSQGRWELLAGRYAPATLDGRPIGATIFVQVSR